VESPSQPSTPPPAGNAGQQVQVRIDDSKVQSTYANAFVTRETPEEVVLDFGLNLAVPAGPGSQPQMLVQLSQRIILNYFTVKKLALTLGQLLRRHEEQFGELELDVAKRAKSGK
jgi:hypothetical protein